MSSYVDILLVILLWDWSAEEFSSGEEEDLLGADQEDEEENPEEQVDQVQEQPDVESLLVSSEAPEVRDSEHVADTSSLIP